MRRFIFFLIVFLNLLNLHGQETAGLEYTSNHLPKMLNGDYDWIYKQLRKDASYFSSYFGGHTKGRDRVIKALKEEAAWLKENGIDTSNIIPVGHTYTLERVVYELKILIGTVYVPMAIVADMWDADVDFVRVYYNLSSIDSINKPQRTFFYDNADLHFIMPPIVSEYLFLHKNRDKDSIPAIIDPEGYVQVMSGDVYRGNSLSTYFDLMLSKGKMIYNPHRLTFDGKRCALEWNLSQWGEERMPALPGLTILEFEAGNYEEIKAVREYSHFPSLNFSSQIDSIFKKNEIEEEIKKESAQTNVKKSSYLILGVVFFVLALFFLFRVLRKKA